jgi:hypothetical protein
MRNSMLTVTFFALMALSLVAFSFTSMFQLLGIIAFAFGANLPDWSKMVKFWQWSGIITIISSTGFFVSKGYGV